MKCLYINLDGARDRRESLEASFHRHAPAGWELVRIPAVGPADVEGVPGDITPTEKACWRSHRTAIFSTLADDEDVLIVEDDTRFGPRTFELLEHVRTRDASWDLCFTEISLRVEAMLPYASRYAQLHADGAVSTNDLAKLSFASAAGYLVRGESKAKIVRLLDGARQDRAYDFHLQDLTHAGRIRSLFFFPFITQPSPHAERSQIQPTAYALRDQAHLAFRRLMHIDRDLDALERELADLESAHADRGAALAGKVLGAFASDAMRISAPSPAAQRAKS